VEEECYTMICALDASNPRTCDLCGKTDHLSLQCPRFDSLMKDPNAARRLLMTLTNIRRQQGDTASTSSTATTPTTSTRGTGSTLPTARRSRTPPTSNRSRIPIRSLEGEDTDDDVSISRLTDDEASVGATPDFI
jgi:hypothetical protein